MTNKEFFTAISTVEGLSEELRAFALESIAKIDAKNAKRASTPSKTAIANEPIKKDLLSKLSAGEPMVAADLAVACGISTQKVSALCGQLVAEGLAVATSVKVKGKGTVKGYLLPVANEEEEEG